MPVVGELHVNVQYGEQTKRLRVIILLLTLDPVSWAEIGYNTYLKLDWHSIHQTILATSDLHSLLTKYSNLFQDNWEQ